MDFLKGEVMRNLICLLVLVVVAVSGCGTTEYVQYAKTQEVVAVAKANAEAARYRALGDIASSGDSSAKVAAVMALALGQSGGRGEGVGIAAPERSQALQWASILVPGLTQIYGIRANADVSMRSSDNAMKTSIATTGGFVSMGDKIQAPGSSSSVVSTTTTNTYSVSGNSGSDSGDRVSVPTVVTQPAPMVVTPTNNSFSLGYTVSGNSGGGSGDSTGAPTVVTPPAPVVVPPSFPPVSSLP